MGGAVGRSSRQLIEFPKKGLTLRVVAELAFASPAPAPAPAPLLRSNELLGKVVFAKRRRIVGSFSFTCPPQLKKDLLVFSCNTTVPIEVGFRDQYR